MNDIKPFHSVCPSCHKVSFVLPEELGATGSYKCPSCGLRYRAEEFWTDPPDEEYRDLSFTSTITAKSDLDEEECESRLPEELGEILIPGELKPDHSKKQNESNPESDSASNSSDPEPLSPQKESSETGVRGSNPEIKTNSDIESTTQKKKLKSPFRDPEKERHHRDSFQARTLSFPVELKYRSIEYGKTFLLVCITLTLILTLALQYAWYNPQQLSGINLPAPLCTVLPCSESAFTADDYNSLFLQVREHPDHVNSLMVSFAFSNDSSREIPFPVARLSFYDEQGAELVAQRDFTPGEYLPDQLSLLDVMPSGSQAQAELEIVDPGLSASRYTLVLLPEL